MSRFLLGSPSELISILDVSPNQQSVFLSIPNLRIFLNFTRKNFIQIFSDSNYSRSKCSPLRKSSIIQLIVEELINQFLNYCPPTITSWSGEGHCSPKPITPTSFEKPTKHDPQGVHPPTQNPLKEGQKNIEKKTRPDQVSPARPDWPGAPHTQRGDPAAQNPSTHPLKSQPANTSALWTRATPFAHTLSLPLSMSLHTTTFGAACFCSASDSDSESEEELWHRWATGWVHSKTGEISLPSPWDPSLHCSDCLPESFCNKWPWPHSLHGATAEANLQCQLEGEIISVLRKEKQQLAFTTTSHKCLKTWRHTKQGSWQILMWTFLNVCVLISKFF